MKYSIGVIGAGVIGTGVAQVYAQSGLNTVLVDISEETLDRAKTKIGNDIRLQNMMQSTRPKVQKDEVLSRICFTTDYSKLASCLFIVENVTENWAIKQDVYHRIEVISRPDCIFGVNTSAIPITKIASLTTRADKVIGIHFMNPVPLMKHVEVIKGVHTSQATIARTKKYLKQVDKTTTVVNDFPGFVSNRISHLFMNEAMFTIQDQVARPEDVDIIFKNCFGHKMGPLQTADLIGLDTVLNTLKVLYENFSDPKYRPCPLLAKMVDAGQLGVKSGQGFYSYEV